MKCANNDLFDPEECIGSAPCSSAGQGGREAKYQLTKAK